MDEECEMEGRGVDRQEQPLEPSEMDQLEPSYWERLLQRAKKAAEEAPDIREDRVAAMKRALQNGTLTLGGKDLAEKLLRETLRNSDLGE
jgi:anti-sigma28 factor (negative regulator of flagellin synthesis)